MNWLKDLQRKRLANALQDPSRFQGMADNAPVGSVGAPGGLVQPQTKAPTNYLANALTAASFAPGIGDAAGIASDARMYLTDPSSRTAGNFALSGLGLLPFVPAMAGRWRPAFHGTTKAFSDFDLGRAMQESGHASADVPGVWAASRPEVAEIFTAHGLRDVTPLADFGPRGAGVKAIGVSRYKEGANVRPLKVKLNNPMIIGNAEAQRLIFGAGDVGGADDYRNAGAGFAEIARKAKEAGHDGIILKGHPRSSALELRGDNFLVFDAAAVKSKFEN
jgi:hypothetical protein